MKRMARVSSSYEMSKLKDEGNVLVDYDELLGIGPSASSSSPSHSRLGAEKAVSGQSGQITASFGAPSHRPRTSAFFDEPGSHRKSRRSDDHPSARGMPQEDLEPLLDTGDEGSRRDRLDSDDGSFKRSFSRSALSLRDMTRGAKSHGFAEKSNSGARRLYLGSGAEPSGQRHQRYPPNAIRNQKYNIITFLPLVLYEQFKFFFNLYFLLVACSQFVPALRVGYIATYVGPLSFVLAVTIGKEAYDDYQRMLRDREANAQKYHVVDPLVKSDVQYHTIVNAEGHDLLDPFAGLSTRKTSSSKLTVGSILLLRKDERIPADCILLRSSEADGSCFVRTDQLDGETDWKLRVAPATTQYLEISALDGELIADAPMKDINNFVGSISVSTSAGPKTEPLSVENTLWANTVLASGSVLAVVIYTGADTRSVMNTSIPTTKVGLLEHEINKLSKILCCATFTLSVTLVALNGFRGPWYTYVFRFLILFSSIIPISLRVNLDMGKTVYAYQIMHDRDIKGTVVRTSTIPEELGRIEYLLADKTGTLTQNEMVLRKLHMGTMSFAYDGMEEVAKQLAEAFSYTQQQPPPNGDFSHMRAHSQLSGLSKTPLRARRDMPSRLRDICQALALCHNVTPASDDANGHSYQASSPDEVAIVRWTESVGLRLKSRTRSQITIETREGQLLCFDILQIFPFTSESKRMGILVRDQATGEIAFYQKGADIVMSKIVASNEWLEEESGNMAREGLRTLVIARKRLSAAEYTQFENAFHQAQLSSTDRAEAMSAVVSGLLEQNLELLGLTGVEDKLQEHVKGTLELLRNAGIKIWMLTGDKIETATCIAISSKLASRNQYIYQVQKLQSPGQVEDTLQFLRSRLDCCLVIDGDSLSLCLKYNKTEFADLATRLSAIVACRCSPTQKADICRLIRSHTRKRVCCIGDGGNDVSMIQAADAGVGIVGKEGKQASLAADFSITQFSHLRKLLVWHGRNSYKRSAKLAQFVIHRGLIIAIMQAVFCSIFYFAPISLFQGWLMIGYATIYTAAPTFSLVLNRDISEELALVYPELYKELTTGRSLNLRTFFTWTAISVYQGGSIMILSLYLFEEAFLNVVSISFSALICNELVMVAVEVTTWHRYMIMAEIVSILIYIISIFFLPAFFDLNFVLTIGFLWRVAVIVSVSAVPLYIFKILRERYAPAAYAKLQQY